MTLKELQEKLAAKRAQARAIFDEAKLDKAANGGERYDFSRVTLVAGIDGDLSNDQKAVLVAKHIQSLAGETEDLAEQCEALQKSQDFADSLSNVVDLKGGLHPDKKGGTDDEPAPISFHKIARAVVLSPEFKQWQRGNNARLELDASWSESKTLFETSAGFPPESTRIGTIVDIPLRPLQVMDIMPRGATGQANVVWMGQDTRTQAAAEVAEGIAKPEATLEFSEQTTPVREIAVFLPITDIQLEDVPFIQSLIETQLREDIDERLDKQVIAGDGIAPNLEGILNVTGILTQARSTDPDLDAIFKAGTKVRTGVARAVPTHVLLNPNNWQFIRLEKDANGQYLMGPPQDTGIPRIFGWPVVENEALSAGTGLIGSFMMRNIGLFERRGIVVERGFIDAQFRANQQSIRASMRAALPTFRPAAFATITGLQS